MNNKTPLVLAGLFLGLGLFTATSHASAAEPTISEKDLNDLQGALTELRTTLNTFSEKLKEGSLKVEDPTVLTQILSHTAADLVTINTTMIAYGVEMNKNPAVNSSENSPETPAVAAEKSNSLLALVNSDMISWLWVLLPFIVILGVIAFLRRRVSVKPSVA